ncbi:MULTISPECIES: hypothetical protein [Dyella]|uniref:Uncharacterized protein n=2 Tax=Dyella TaxID=231454 RepID=A0A4R0YT77_9GAMM|nr:MULTISPECIES: hypothetical protein [Dyella]TBR36621.1 hypothetical protein EYV96_11870 [Dyella terrae]TCI08287.1 hypothetical protein EZM97_27000 [Dyella soli]
MHTLTLSVSLPDAAHPAMELRLSSDDSPCDVVIALPAPNASNVIPLPPRQRDDASADDDYVLGGYAGI